MIHLEQLEKVYHRPDGPVHALSGIDLDIAAGEFVVVRGPSGCGKSTLLSLIGGLAMPTAGRVRVAGEEISHMSAAQRAGFRARYIGFVFQTFHLLPYLTVQENVVTAAKKAGSDAWQRAERLLKDFHLGHRLGHRPAELSTGECQRVAIARALMNGPSLILADEPTGNLDPENAETVLDLLAQFHRGGGTILVVTHQEMASKYSQRTIRLSNGSLIGGAAMAEPCKN